MRHPEMKGIKIAIKFGDNDFGNTFYAVLKFLHEAFKHTGHLPTDKKKLQWLINSLSPIIYVSHQNQWEYNGLEEAEGDTTDTNKEFLHTKKYLIKGVRLEDILVNEEVDDYIKSTDWDNSETFILDTHLYNNNVYSL